MPRLNRNSENSIPVSVLKERLVYSPTTGEIRRKKRDRLLPGQRASDAGKIATHLTKGGYHRCFVADRNVMAHRVAWAMFYGEWPDKYIDHINGDRADNRIENLRIATHSQNLRNSAVKAAAASGAKGVAFRRGVWESRIRIEGKMIHLGSFLTRDEAIASFRTAALLLHGEFMAPIERAVQSQHFAPLPL